MNFFPQLSTGSSLQYPFQRSQVLRTLKTAGEDGTVSKYSDGGWRNVQWELEFAGLNSSEWASIRGHFAMAEGRLNSFPFLDGSDNLLLWSEDLSNSAWMVDPLLQVSPSVADPNNTNHGNGIHNAGIALQGISQTIAAPASFTYCFSLFARSTSGSQMILTINGNGQQLQQTVTVGSDWRRYMVSGNLPGSDNLVRFGLQIEPANRVDLYGLQVEPQMGASRYKKTTSLCGTHADCRYDQDQLGVTSDREGSYSTTIRLISREPI